MSFIEAVRTCFQKYVTVSGRAGRSEYWFFALFAVIVSIIANAVDIALGFGTITAGTDASSFSASAQSSGPIGALVYLGLLPPSICVGVRRLHDISRTGWWLLISFLPLIGFIVLLVFFIQHGTLGPNRFGPDPKGGSEDAKA